MQENAHIPHTGADRIHLPSPTAWPMVLALGITLVLAGLITHVTITLLGTVLAIYASIGWFRCVLPHEQHEDVTVQASDADRTLAAALEPPAPPVAPHLSQRTYSFISGIEAGIAGGLAMAVVATVFSLLRFHSLWYAVNLLAASSFLGWTGVSDAFLSGFHMEGLLVGLAIHALVSVLIGLLYASIMPIFPRLALLTGGLLTPLAWTILAWSLMTSVTPVLAARVDWIWFILSQLAFGLTAVFTVNLRVRFRSAAFQQLPFDQRAGLHSGQANRSADNEVRQ